MIPAWLADAAALEKRGNELLFSRKSECLQGLMAHLRVQSHQTIVLWAFTCCERTIGRLAARWPEEQRPARALTAARLWAQGDIKMPVARKAILLAHAAAKEAPDSVCAALCHAIGQGCSAVHTETHAIGLPIYELTAFARENGVEAAAPQIHECMYEYLRDIRLAAAEAAQPGLRWAKFLQREGPNREQLRAQKDAQVRLGRTYETEYEIDIE